MENNMELKKIDYKNLNTRRLFSYYKSLMSKYIYSGIFQCDCCGEFMWNMYPNQYDELKIFYDEVSPYIDNVKNELNTREHIKDK